MQVFYYSDRSETPNGPHNASVMGDLLRDKVITPLTRAARAGAAEWQELKNLPEYKAIRESAITRQPKVKGIPSNWAKWCKSGSYAELHKAEAVRKCLENGQVRGHFSDFVLRPDLDQNHSMYPSFEHLTDSTNHTDAVVEARIINTMKSHLSEE